MTIRTYRDLIVWQKSMQIVAQIYRATAAFPREELYGLTSQIRRAAVSLPSNLAEGHGRGTRRDYQRFVRITIGSLCELQTQLTLAAELGYLAPTTSRELDDSLREIERMLSSLLRRLKEERTDS